MSTSKKRIKILITCHKPAKYIKSDIIEPIQVNSANSKALFPDMLHDNDGKNISELNPMYCELTAQYWAWKNLDADYYGFFHYRRYMSFSGDWQEDDYGNVVEDALLNDFEQKYGLDDENVRKIVEAHDMVLPVCKDTAKMPGMGKNMYSQYAASGFLNLADLEIMKDVIREKYPEYESYAEAYMDGHMSYLNNMYIMKKELFFDYCKWLFDVLAECHKRIDYTNYTVEAYRTVGHLAERLFNIYTMKLKHDHPELKMKELQTVYIKNTDVDEVSEPAFKTNNVPVVFSANNYYVPYLGVTIESLIEHTSNKSNYDIIIMNKDMSAHNKKRLKNLASGHNNISIRFLDISAHEVRFKKMFLRGHFTIETWFRLLMPEILPRYSKLLYMDADIVINADVAELYKVNINGYLLGACHDADTAGLYNGYEKNKKNYMDNILKIQKPYEYFQAGVLLFNLDEFRKQTSVDEMLKFAGSYDWELLDQDVLNYLAQGKVKYVDMAWNVMYDWLFKRRKEIISLAPKVLQDEYDKAYMSPKVVHYAGPNKPWQDPSVDYADLFWQYARNTVFYEELLARMPLLDPLYKEDVGIVKKAARKILPKDSAVGNAARKAYAKLRG